MARLLYSHLMTNLEDLRTLGEIAQVGASRSGRAPALISHDVAWTFTDLWNRISGLTHLLGGITAQPVAVLSENVADFVTLLYGLPGLHCPVVPINIRHNSSDIQAQLDQFNIKVLISSPQQLDRVYHDLKLDELDSVMTIHGDHHAATRNLTSALDQYCAQQSPTTALLVETSSGHGRRGGGPTQTAASAFQSDCAWIINTSGTTGEPKGVMLSHENILAAIRSTAIGRPLAHDDKYLFPFPLFHVAAYNVFNAHAHQRPVVLMEKFDAEEFLLTVERHGVTNCSLAPTMVQMLLARGNTAIEAMSQLRQISYGASSMPRDLLVQLAEQLPHVGLAQGYGMTELGGNAVFLTPRDHRAALGDRPELLRSAGRAPGTVSIRIADEHGEPVQTGIAGEILVAGPQVCMGYWNNPKATQDSRYGEWFRTGDIGMLDEDGYLYILDRLKDIIITGGENVSSREVEDSVSLHPLVRQVAVIGVPDDQWGELIVAVVVVHDGFDQREFATWVRTQLSSFKQPRRVHVVHELPVNASGKIDKVLLRRQFGGHGSVESNGY